MNTPLKSPSAFHLIVRKRLMTVGILLIIISLMAQAQDNDYSDIRRSWAVDAQVGGSLMQHSLHQGADIPMFRMGSTNNDGVLVKFHVEKYFADGKASMKLGYEHEEVNLLEGDYSGNLSELMAGGRWYPAPKAWFVQPYIGGDLFLNIDPAKGEFDMTSTSTGYTYQVKGFEKMPKFSLGPVAGIDLYLFSCIALQVEYGYRWGIDGRVNGLYAESRSSNTAMRHARVHRHAISAGLKVTFPFSFSRGDSKSLREAAVPSLFDILFGN